MFIVARVVLIVSFLYFCPGVLADIRKDEKKDVASLDKEYHLKCWQHGELLFEETGLYKDEYKSNFSSATFKKSDDRKSIINLIQIGNSTCLYKKM